MAIHVNSRCFLPTWHPITQCHFSHNNWYHCNKSSYCTSVTVCVNLAVACTRDTQMELDQNNLEIVGACLYSYGQICVYQCRIGYSSVEIMQRTCLETGKMSPRLPVCRGMCSCVVQVLLKFHASIFHTAYIDKSPLCLE